MNRHALIVGATAMLTGCSVVHEPDGSVLEARLDERVPALLEEHDVPSAGVAVIRGGEVVFAEVYGEQSPGVAATQDTLYNVASLSKPITAETMLRLAEAGRISLDEPIAPYFVDEDIADDPHARAVTPRLVMKHETGLPNWRYQTDGELRFLRLPGEEVGYSGEGFEWLARAIERKLDTPFETLAETYVFEPAGMNDTSYTRKDWFEGRLAEPYAGGKEVMNVVRDEFSAADDLRTTPADYARFLVDTFEGSGTELAVTRETVDRHYSWMQPCADEVTAERPCPDRMGWSQGWMVFDYAGEKMVYHDGGDFGEKTVAFYVPARREGVVVFTNGANGADVMFAVVREVFDHPHFNELMVRSLQ
jgi:CubicO group peptidase (beta-lactamase class C family)